MHLRVLGISAMCGPPIILQTQAFVTIYRLFVSFAFLFLQIPLIWFMIFQADSFEVYAEILTVIGSAILASITFWCFLWDKTTILNLIDDLNDLIRKSKEF